MHEIETLESTDKYQIILAKYKKVLMFLFIQVRAPEVPQVPQVPREPLSSGYSCLSSDSQPTFELKGLTGPSAPPLSSYSTTSDVYTSDKLNFL